MKINLTVECADVKEAHDVLAKLSFAGANVSVGAGVGGYGGGAPAPMPAAPQPAPLPPVPAAAAEEEVSDANVAGLVDSSGLPWDGRIHSSSKKTKADGTWTAKRNVREDEVKAVEAELRARVQAPAAPAPLPAAPLPPAPMAAAPQPAAPAPLPMPPAPSTDAQAAAASYGTVLPAAPQPAAPAPLPPAPIPAAPARDFSGFMTRIQRNAQAGKITQDFINLHIVGAINAQSVFQVQMKSPTDMQTRPDIVEYAHQILDANQML